MREVRLQLAPWLRSQRTGVLLALAPLLETALFAAAVASAGRVGRASGLAAEAPRYALFASLVALAAVIPCTLAPLYAAALATDREDHAAAAAARTGSSRYDCTFVAECLRALCLVWASAPPVLLAYVVLRPSGGIELCLGLHAVAFLAVAASSAAAVLAPSRLVAGVAGYTAVCAGIGVACAAAWRLAPYHQVLGVRGYDLALPASCAVVACAFAVVGRAAARRRGAHYR